MTTKIKKGDMIELDFIGTFKESGEIFDLTIEKIAKENNIYDPKFKYKPMRAFVGTGQLLKGIDEKITGSEVSKVLEFDLDPVNAFGKRDPKLIQLVSLNKLKSKRVNPVVGMQLDIDGKVATIRSVNSGRVILDFNHPFSGRKVHYWLKTKKVITDIKTKVEFTIQLIGFKVENLSVTEGKVKFNLANKEKLGKEFLDLLKNQIKKFVPEIKTIAIA